MKSGVVRVAETEFISTETFTQKRFKDWVENRPMGDINRYELASGKIVMTPPAAWEHAKIEAVHGWFDLRPFAGEEDMIFVCVSQ